MRRIIAGNWKMNMTAKEAEIFKNIKSKVQNAKAEVVFCVPYLAIDASLRAVAGTDICIGAQNMHYLDNGAYTGRFLRRCFRKPVLTMSLLVIRNGECITMKPMRVSIKIIKALETNIKPIFA